MGATAETHAAAGVPRTVGALLQEMARLLARAPTVDKAADEARELVAALLEAPRYWPGAHTDAEIDDAVWSHALAAAAKRARGAPLAYCVGRASFRHLTLEVDERVLIPRPETELLVDVAMAAIGPAAGGIAVDVGTGSGAIALALATEARFDRVVATDVSLDALTVARRNMRLAHDRLRAPVELRHGSLLRPVEEVQLRLVVSNPPYIANREASDLPASVRDWEPPEALLSGEDGMWATARLVRQAADKLAPGGMLALEVDPRRAEAVATLAAATRRYIGVTVKLDLAGRERFVIARREEEA
jgi:release factor glutamine methyltransferase